MKEMVYSSKNGNEIKMVVQCEAKEDYTMVGGVAQGNGKWFISTDITFFVDGKVYDKSRDPELTRAPANNAGVAYVMGRTGFTADRAEEVKAVIAAELATAEANPGYAAYVAAKEKAEATAAKTEEAYNRSYDAIKAAMSY